MDQKVLGVIISAVVLAVLAAALVSAWIFQKRRTEPQLEGQRVPPAHDPAATGRGVPQLEGQRVSPVPTPRLVRPETVPTPRQPLGERGCFLCAESALSVMPASGRCPWKGNFIVVNSTERVLESACWTRYDGLSELHAALQTGGAGVSPQGALPKAAQAGGELPVFFYSGMRCPLRRISILQVQELSIPFPPSVPASTSSRTVFHELGKLLYRVFSDVRGSNPSSDTVLLIPPLHSEVTMAHLSQESYHAIFAAALSNAIGQFVPEGQSLSEFLGVREVRICCAGVEMQNALTAALESQVQLERGYARRT